MDEEALQDLVVFLCAAFLLISQYFELTREVSVSDSPGKTISVTEEFPLSEAERIIAAAPAPWHNRGKGRRPHAHFDREGFFEAEKATLMPLEGVNHNTEGPTPVLWAYPAEDFDYFHQNSKGKVEGKHIGPCRIITDRDKQIQGMVIHPIKDEGDFVRGPKRVRRSFP